MKQKGFTLIELLAVIVILAIIALIVTPIVTGIIAQARESANARSVEGHITDVNYAILTLTMANGQDMSSYDVASGALSTAITSQVQSTNSADTISCTSYTISNGIVTAASGCTQTGWTKSYTYSNTAGAK